MNFEVMGEYIEYGFTSPITIDLTLVEYCVKFKQNFCILCGLG